MKKTDGLIIAIMLAAALIAGCAANAGNMPAATEAPKATETPAATEMPEEPQPIQGDALRDGSYEITVSSSSSMFRIVKAQLTVKQGAMEAIITMSGQGYGKLFMGTGEEALAASEEQYIPFQLDSEGNKTFTVPVEALNQEIDCAAWSIKKETWYDRTLVFQSDLIPDEAWIKQ